MSKKLFSLAAAALIALGASAQEYSTWTHVSDTVVSQDKYKVETNHFWNNWFISAGGGVQFLYGDLDKYMKFGKRLKPAIDVSVGKWFTPGIGVQLSYSGFKLKGLWTDAGANFPTNTLVKSDDLRDKFYDKRGKDAKAYEQEAKYFNIHADAMFNLSNLLCGYNEHRFWNVVPMIGVGLARTYDHNGDRGNTISFNAGLLNKFRLCDRFDLNLLIRGAILDDDFDGEQSNADANVPFDGIGGVTLGLTWRIGKQGWNKSRSVTTTITNDEEINRLNLVINDLRNENDRLKKNTGKNQIVTFPYLVNFVRDKVVVVNRERVNLGNVAQMIKATPGKKYSVIGYADKQTGSVDRNIWLAENRAKNVYDVLVNEFGVDPNQLVLDSKGGVDYMYYNDEQCSRSVIIQEVK